MKGLLILFCAFFLVLNISVNAQPVLDRQEPLQKQKEMKKASFHMYYGINILSAGVKEDSIDYFKGGSPGMSLGFAFERLFGKHFAIGLDVVPLSYNWYTFKNDGSFKLPDTLSHFKEKYRGNVGQLGAYLRFSANRFTEVSGLHIDLGANLSLPYYYRYVHVDHTGGYKIKTITSGLDNSVYYSLFARLGCGFVDLYASYRLTDVFLNSTPYPQPPKINMGVLIVLPDFNPSN